MADPSVPFEHAFRLHQQGRLQEALTGYERVLAQWPTHADALHYSGLALYQIGQPDAAARRIELSLKSDSRAPEPWCNLALVYQALDRHDAAIAALYEALRRDPAHAEIWNNLANALLTTGRADEAEQAARRAVALADAYAPGWFNLALALQAQGRLDEALEMSTKAAHLAPGEVAPAGLKAQIEEASGRLDAARTTLDAALVRHRAAAPLHFQRASVEEHAGNLAAAAQSCERVLQVSPKDGAALSQLLFLRKRQADWHDLPALRARFRAGVASGQTQLTPFCLLSDPSTRSEQRACAERWSASFNAAPRDRARPLSADRLRIGYLSADFRQHATAVLTAGLFEQHDRRRFVINGYSTGPDDQSLLRTRLTAAFDHFVDACGWPPKRLAAQVRADGIDVLVDLKGHTDGAPTAVCALRPAPIQVNYLGYPGTMGAAFIDYLIGDAIVTPFEHVNDYSEALVQLPESYQINDRQRAIVEPPTRRELGLPDDGLVFCCFNSSYKLNPDVFDAWMRILAAVPRSILWLLQHSIADPLIANLRREAAARGVDPSRLVVAQHLPNAEYLGLYRHADLFLDTWPYNAHTTASDALWAGCPVLTWLGETFAGRVAASLLTAVGLPELIAADAAAYVERAIALAGDAATLANYHAYLLGPGHDGPLFDTAATTRALEAAYFQMAAQYRNGARAPFRISSSDL